MHVAFHFLADAPVYRGNYGLQILEKFFGILLDADKDFVHLKISVGDLLAYDYAHTPEARELLAVELLCFDHPIWRDIDADQFAETIFTANVFVLAVDGLTTNLRDHLNASLRRDETYLGGIQIYEGNRSHWVVYSQSLVKMYRYLEGNLRIFYNMDDDDSKDIALESHWRRLPFLSVTWENQGLHHTIFDVSDTFDNARRTAELGELLSANLAQLASDILLRLSDINPQLADILAKEFREFQHIDTVEDCAQVALSCRRFLERLANSIYPARNTKKGEHKLGRVEYRNRLWKYVEEHLTSDTSKEVVLAQLKDVGNRIDKIDGLAHKGVHAEISASEVHRLRMGLLVLVFDLLWIAPFPQRLPDDPESVNFLLQVMKESDRDDDVK